MQQNIGGCTKSWQSPEKIRQWVRYSLETATDSLQMARYSLETGRDPVDTARVQRLSRNCQRRAGDTMESDRCSLETIRYPLKTARHPLETARLSGDCQTFWRLSDSLETAIDSLERGRDSMETATAHHTIIVS